MKLIALDVQMRNYNRPPVHFTYCPNLTDHGINKPVSRILTGEKIWVKLTFIEVRIFSGKECFRNRKKKLKTFRISLLFDWNEKVSLLFLWGNLKGRSMRGSSLSVLFPKAFERNPRLWEVTSENNLTVKKGKKGWKNFKLTAWSFIYFL